MARLRAMGRAIKESGGSECATKNLATRLYFRTYVLFATGVFPIWANRLGTLTTNAQLKM